MQTPPNATVYAPDSRPFPADGEILPGTSARPRRPLPPILTEPCILGNDQGRGAEPVTISAILDKLTPSEMRGMLAGLSGSAPAAFERVLLEEWSWRGRLPKILAQADAFQTYAPNIAAAAR
jgi:hypothetical protein